MSDVIKAIEQAYAFELPALYHQLYHDGMLDWFPDGGFPNPNWHSDVFPRLRRKPPVLLFVQDFELYAPETVPDLLPEAEFKEIVQREMGFDLLNHTFAHFPE